MESEMNGGFLCVVWCRLGSNQGGVVAHLLRWVTLGERWHTRHLGSLELARVDISVHNGDLDASWKSKTRSTRVRTTRGRHRKPLVP